MKVINFSVGRDHFGNEDRLKVIDIGEDAIVAILADGMGGSDSGSIAAETIVESIASFVKKQYEDCNEQQTIYKALDYANEQLAKTNTEKKIKTGAAVAVALITKQQMYYTWQGNVRIYVCNQGHTKLITNDHLVHIGYGNTALTRCIKGEPLYEDVPFGFMSIEPNDIIWICSDGFYSSAEQFIGTLSPDIINKKLTQVDDDASYICISEFLL